MGDGDNQSDRGSGSVHIRQPTFQHSMSLLSHHHHHHESALDSFKRSLARRRGFRGDAEDHVQNLGCVDQCLRRAWSQDPNQPPRLIFKNGEFSISAENVPREKWRYLQDIFTTILELRWRYCFLLFSLTYMISWTFYATLWYLIALIHGDTDPANTSNPDYRPCVTFVHNFTTALLYSLETQTTIGYGFRHVTDQCPQAIILIMFQCLSGVIIEAFMVGYIFTKLARPSRRAQTIIFSEEAVVSMRDGVLCLCIRVADMRRRQHLLSSNVKGLLIRTKMTDEGDRLPLFQQSLSIGPDEIADSQMFMFWPIILVHKIDADSPLYDMSPESLATDSFEIVIVLEGTVEATGMTAQVRTSYLASEIVWGRKFKPLVGFHSDEGIYRIDYSRFCETESDLVPPVSARQLAADPQRWRNWASETKRAMQMMMIDDPYSIGTNFDQPLAPPPAPSSKMGAGASQIDSCISEQPEPSLSPVEEEKSEKYEPAKEDDVGEKSKDK